VTVNILTPFDFCYAPGCEPVSVTFGDVPGTALSHGNETNWLIATVPAHAAGAVDVKLSNRFKTITARSEFVYFGESGPSDPVMFEPVVFPLLTESDGAGGTHWKTDAIVSNGSHETQLVTQWPIDATGYVPPDTWHAVRGAASHPRGVVWLPLRETSNGVSASLTVRETTRGAAFEVPILREGAFSSNVFIAGIPRDPRYRVTLRVYSLDNPAPFAPEPVLVTVSGLETYLPRGAATVTLARHGEDEPYFAQIDNLQTLPLSTFDRTSPDTMLKIWISGVAQRVWAFVSIIDNETQQARIITPLK
jgi:hypothetical protein